MSEATVKRLDDVLPAWHHRERHTCAVAAPPDRALAALLAVSFDEMPAVRLLLRLRGFRAAPRGSLVETLAQHGFRREGDLLLLVAKPWRPAGGRRDVEDFAGFDEPGWAKIAMDFRAVPAPSGARLETETRILLTDAAARRRFRLYWLVVRPFSGLLRRSWLAAARRRGET